MQAKKPTGTEAAAGMRKFEKDNNIVEEEFYSYDEAEYEKLLGQRPWKSKYACLCYE